MPKLSRKDKQIANAHVKGVKNKDIGKIHYPNANPNSQAVLVSSTLKKPHVAQYVEQSKTIALKELGVTWKRIAQTFVDALDANKQNQFTGEINPDHAIRMQAGKNLANLMEDKNKEEVNEVIGNIPNVDEVQLIRLLKNKT